MNINICSCMMLAKNVFTNKEILKLLSKGWTTKARLSSKHLVLVSYRNFRGKVKKQSLILTS